MVRLLLFLFLLLTSCDAFKDDRVEITYWLRSSSSETIADVRYLDSDGQRILIKNARSGWEHSIKVEEGEQLVYISILNIRNGSMGARISIDSELVAEAVAGPGKSKSTSFWGADENIKIYYTLNTGHPGYAQFTTPSGLDSLNAEDFSIQDGPTGVEIREYVVDAGFKANLAIQGQGIWAGDPCLALGVDYEPIPGERFSLINQRECNPEFFAIGFTADVPGYSPGF